MLVYSTALWIAPEEGFDKPLEIAARWLSRKAGKRIAGDELKEDQQYQLKNRQRLQTWIADGEFPMMFAFRYSHPDRDIYGREWVTEFGIQLEAGGAEMLCTVLLQVEDISPRVDAPISVTQPGFVADIANGCELSPRTIGYEVRSLTVESAETFGDEVHRRDRRHPLIVVSALPDGSYFIPAAQLGKSLLGLGQVYEIPADADTHEISRIAGRDYTAWRGGINIVRAPRLVRGNYVVRHRRILQADFERIGPTPAQRRSEILGHIVHDSNADSARQHIAPKTVRRISESRERRRELERRLKDVHETGEQADLVKFLQEAYNEHAGRIGALEQENDELEVALGDRDDQIRALEYQNANLTTALAGIPQRGASDLGFDVEVREALRAVLDRTPTPKEALVAVSALYPERLIVLDTAWKSAEESAAFQRGGDAFELLTSLAGSYWESLHDGIGDSEARSVFGSAFAATESESVRNNKRAKRLRTFSYDGEDVEMMAHLKIGNKDSVAETLRIHFYWDSDKEKLVIGHCGKHLDHR
jgi:hypothetical protein